MCGGGGGGHSPGRIGLRKGLRKGLSDGPIPRADESRRREATTKKRNRRDRFNWSADQCGLVVPWNCGH